MVVPGGHIHCCRKGELRDPRFQGGHLAGQVVGGPFRGDHQGVAALFQHLSRLMEGRTVQPAPVDGNPAAALQQPADQGARPDRDPAVVEKPQRHRAQQGLLKPLRLPGNPVPEQIRQHNGIPCAGVTEGDQQTGFTTLLCGDRPGQLSRCIAIPTFQPLKAKQAWQQPSYHGLHPAAGPCGQSTQGRPGGLRCSAWHRAGDRHAHTDPMDLLLEPLAHAFMVRALLVSALVGGVCGLLSCYMTLKGWALMGDAVSHAVLPGVVVAYALGLPFSVGAFVFGVGSVAAIGFVKQKSRVKEDTVIGLVFTGFFALGLVLVSKTRSNIDLTHILFGNVLGITAGDLQQTLLISAIVLAFLLLLRRDLMLFCFDPTHARSIGINTGVLHYLLLGLLSLAAVAGLQTVGIILVVAMLVTPGATAYLLTDRFDRMTVLAVLSSVLSSVLGVFISYWTDSSTAGCIVLAQTLQFLLAFLFAPKHGVLRSHGDLTP